MRRPHRIVVALLTLLALLFSQAVVAAHACAMQSPVQAAADMPCHQDGKVAPPCASHFDFGNASVDSAKAPLPMPQLVQSALRVPTLVSLAAPRQVRLEQRALPAPEPPTTRFVVLRI